MALAEREGVMERLGTERVMIRDLVGYQEIKKRMEQPHIERRAESVRELGLLHRPIARKRDSRLICGFDRCASLLKAGIDDVEVEWVECDDDEFERIRVTENVHRRHEPGEATRAIKKLSKVFEAQISKDEPAEDVRLPIARHEVRERGRGRPKTVKGKANDKIADVLGIKPESVRRSQERAAAKERQQLAARSKFPTFGRKVDDRWLAGTELAKTYIEEAHNKLKAAMSAITKLKNAKTPYPDGSIQKLYDRIEECSNFVKDRVPVSMCPYCKRIPEITSNCSACLTSGFIQRKQKSVVPEELWRGDDQLVSWNGAFVPATNFKAEEVADPPTLEELQQELAEAFDEAPEPEPEEQEASFDL